MSPTLVWISYAVLFLAALIYYILSAYERTYARITLPQLLYVVYMVGCSYLVVSTSRDIAISLIYLACPAGLVAWFTFTEEYSLKIISVKDELQRKLDVHRAALKAKPDDIILLETTGDIYRQLGEAALARKYYGRLIAIYDAKPQCDRLKHAVQEKSNDVEINPDAVDDLRIPEAIRACPQCESVVLRLEYACPRCDCPIFPGRGLWRAVRFNRFFEKFNLTRITACGLLLLPFLFACGWTAYGLLWGVWTLVFSARGVGT